MSTSPEDPRTRANARSVRSLVGSWWVVVSAAIILAALLAVGYFFVRPLVGGLIDTATSPSFAEADLSEVLEPLKGDAATHPEAATLVRTWEVTDCWGASGSPYVRFHYLTSDSAEANIAYFQSRLSGTGWSLKPTSPGFDGSKHASFKQRVQGRMAFIEVSQVHDGELEVTLSSICRRSDPD